MLLFRGFSKIISHINMHTFVDGNWPRRTCVIYWHETKVFFASIWGLKNWWNFSECMRRSFFLLFFVQSLERRKIIPRRREERKNIGLRVPRFATDECRMVKCRGGGEPALENASIKSRRRILSIFDWYTKQTGGIWLNIWLEGKAQTHTSAPHSWINSYILCTTLARRGTTRNMGSTVTYPAIFPQFGGKTLAKIDSSRPKKRALHILPV